MYILNVNCFECKNCLIATVIKLKTLRVKIARKVSFFFMSVDKK